MSRGYRGGDAIVYYEDTWEDGQVIPITPSWNEIGLVIDASTSQSKSEVNVSSRSSKYQKNRGGLKTFSLQLTYRMLNQADADYEKLWESYDQEKALLFLVMSGAYDSAGNKGWQFPGLVFSLDESEPLEDGASSSINIGLAFAVDDQAAEIDPVRVIAT